MDSEELAYEEVNRQFGKTSKILFGTEIGDLREYEKWLKSSNKKMMTEKSSVSGEDVPLFVTNYLPGSRFCSYDEAMAGLSEPIGINEMKDIDSLAEAVRERILYVGNVVLGNSRFVSKSSNVYDSFYVYDAGAVTDCKYAGCCTEVRMCESVFGCKMTGVTKHSMRGYEMFTDNRCLEVSKGFFCNDCYFSQSLFNCNSCMYSFNLMNKSHCIGNLELGKDKYASIRNGLVSQMAEEVQRDKKLPSLVELARGSSQKADDSLLRSIADSDPVPAGDLEKIQKSFDSAANIILGKKLGRITDYAEWLQRYTADPSEYKSCASRRPIFVYDHANFKEFPPDRLLTLKEGERFGRIAKLSEKEIANGLVESLGKIAYFSPEIGVGNAENLIDCPTYEDSVDCMRCDAVYCCKSSSYCFWPRDSEFLFGSNTVFVSSFGIKCYFSKNIKRCFEIDSSSNSSDCYFCHNVENVHNGLFCFNKKNLSYAVGNNEVGREKFGKVKGMLLDYVNLQLEKKKDLLLSVYDLKIKMSEQ